MRGRDRRTWSDLKVLERPLILSAAIAIGEIEKPAHAEIAGKYLALTPRSARYLIVAGMSGCTFTTHRASLPAPANRIAIQNRMLTKLSFDVFLAPERHFGAKIQGGD